MRVRDMTAKLVATQDPEGELVVFYNGGRVRVQRVVKVDGGVEVYLGRFAEDPRTGDPARHREDHEHEGKR